MHVFLSYIYRIRFFIAFFVIETALLSSIMMLNNVSYEEIIYGICILVFIALVAGIYGFYSFYRSYKELKKFEKNIEVSVGNLPLPNGCIEEEYQVLIKKLVCYFNTLLDKNANTFKEMEEYYTMWVHQIKTPIAAMKLLLQEKPAEFDVSYEQAQLFKIEQYAEMALQYMRLGSQSTDFVIKRVNLHNVVKEAVHKYARMFIQKRIKLDFKDFDISVISDEKWLGFVIGQILSNAIKYTNKGSVSINCEKGVSCVTLIIEDTGAGINSADLPRICEKGYTGYNGHDSYNGKFSTGIGLYMCSKIIKKLSHRMEIESEEGKGTKVKIIFKTGGGN
ncbi:MAG: HAMP domain-containing histidine kinase [Lachnospiraceae bacterium]|nr:HAMP domain-containing histidine kinase [Lachnospiraceae bacterium]